MTIPEGLAAGFVLAVFVAGWLVLLAWVAIGLWDLLRGWWHRRQSRERLRWR